MRQQIISLDENNELQITERNVLSLFRNKRTYIEIDGLEIKFVYPNPEDIINLVKIIIEKDIDLKKIKKMQERLPSHLEECSILELENKIQEYDFKLAEIAKELEYKDKIKSLEEDYSKQMKALTQLNDDIFKMGEYLSPRQESSFKSWFDLSLIKEFNHNNKNDNSDVLFGAKTKIQDQIRLLNEHINQYKIKVARIEEYKAEKLNISKQLEDLKNCREYQQLQEEAKPFAFIANQDFIPLLCKQLFKEAFKEIRTNFIAETVKDMLELKDLGKKWQTYFLQSYKGHAVVTAEAIDSLKSRGGEREIDYYIQLDKPNFFYLLFLKCLKFLIDLIKPFKWASHITIDLHTLHDEKIRSWIMDILLPNIEKDFGIQLDNIQPSPAKSNWHEYSSAAEARIFREQC